MTQMQLKTNNNNNKQTKTRRKGEAKSLISVEGIVLKYAQTKWEWNRFNMAKFPELSGYIASVKDIASKTNHCMKQYTISLQYYQKEKKSGRVMNF